MNWTGQATSSDQGLIIDDETGKNIAVAYDTKHTNLIAAAPAMREALRELLNDPYLSDPINAQRMAKAWAAYQLTIEEQA